MASALLDTPVAIRPRATDVHSAAAALEGAPAEDVVAWAVDRYGEGLVLASSFQNLTFTADPIASSLFTSAQHAQDVGLLKPVDLKGIYDLGPLNELLKADGQPPVSDAAAA